MHKWITAGLCVLVAVLLVNAVLDTVLWKKDSARLDKLEAASTVAQQPQERNICDTIVEYKVFYPAGSLHIGGGVNKNDTSLTIYYSK